VPMIKILIADDHPVVRQGLARILAKDPELSVVDEVGNGAEVVDKVRRGGYDVILLDVSLPGMNGLEVLKQLRIDMPKLPVLMLSVHPEEQYAIRALKAGASGYLTKASAPEELVTAIKTLAKGRQYITPSLGERLAAEVRDLADKKPPHEALTDREYDVLCRLGRGQTGGEIAADLSLSAKTVSTYRARILSKMGMSNNAQLMRYVLEQGLGDG
jgi:two-component system, NarL family, invasion response regulator UvrY